MRGEFNGLQAIIKELNQFAYYQHCWSHRLQLALVAAAKDVPMISMFFLMISDIVNVAGGSCKRSDVRLSTHKQTVEALIDFGTTETGRGLNQETFLSQPGDTRWGSHWKSLIRLMSMWRAVVEVLKIVESEGSTNGQRAEACRLLDAMDTHRFVFILHMMIDLMGITNDLSQALQRKDQDIVNAMDLVFVAKQRLQITRGNEIRQSVGECDCVL